MDDAALVAIATLAVTAILVPTAKWIAGLLEDRAELRLYREDVPDAIHELKLAADTMRKQSRPSPYCRPTKRPRQPAARETRSRRR